VQAQFPPQNTRQRSGDGGFPTENTVEVYISPEGKTVTFEHGKLPYKDHGKEESLLDVALTLAFISIMLVAGIAPATTCHVWVKEGKDLISEMEDDEATSSIWLRPAIKLAPRMPGCDQQTGQSCCRDPSMESELRFGNTLKTAFCS